MTNSVGSLDAIESTYPSSKDIRLFYEILHKDTVLTRK